MNKILKWAKASDENLKKLIDIVIDDDNMMGGYEDQMESIFVEVYGERVGCPDCGSGVFPGHLCWGCEEWTAPEVNEGLLVDAFKKILIMQMPTIKDWSWNGNSISGKAYNHPDARFSDGKLMITSTVTNVYYKDDRLFAECKSRTYLLDGIDPEYEKLFPNAEERLVKVWAERVS